MSLFTELGRAAEFRAETSQVEDVEESVRENLKRLVSVRRGAVLVDPHYGIDDVKLVFHGSASGVNAWQDGLMRAIQLYEPRLQDVEIKTSRQGLVLHAEVAGILIINGGKRRFVFRMPVTEHARPEDSARESIAATVRRLVLRAGGRWTEQRRLLLDGSTRESTGWSQASVEQWQLELSQAITHHEPRLQGITVQITPDGHVLHVAIFGTMTFAGRSTPLALRLPFNSELGSS